jgi:hypothetical protein
MKSPFENHMVANWDAVTQQLIDEHPLDEREIVDVVLEAWDKIMLTKIGGKLQIGVDVFPSPQIMGNYLHLLIAAILQERHPNEWRGEVDKSDKDVVYIPNDEYSIEIKTSSQNSIYGNRSYGQDNSDNSSGKQKFGFYLAINFEKFTQSNTHPQIKRIKFGWIDHEDWKAQVAATGQNSTLDKDAWNHKLKLLYER